MRINIRELTQEYLSTAILKSYFKPQHEIVVKTSIITIPQISWEL